MAKMIPEIRELEDFNGSFGEMRVYDALKQLPNEYVVFHSVKWNKKVRNHIEWGEADFTILHPKKGILVVEVKSGGISHNNYIGWEQTNTLDGTTKRMKDPMDQAGKSKYAFIDLLAPKFDCYIESIVWFPSLENRSQLKELPPAYSIENTLIQSDLEHVEDSIIRAFNYYKMQNKTDLTNGDMKEIIQILSPVFNAVPGIVSSMKDQDYQFNKLTAEQSYLLDYLEEQQQAVIQGGAGTGKTMLALEKARRLSKEDKVLFLCYNSMLLESLRSLNKDSNIDFYNLQGLVLKLSEGKVCRDDDGITTFLSQLDINKWPYKHIIIDEGQDFLESHLEVLKDITGFTEGNFYVFYDKNQLVQQKGDLGWFNDVECRLVLTANCRNTESIALTALAPLGIDKIKMKYSIPGRKTHLYVDGKFTYRDNLIDTLVQIISNYVDNGVDVENIVIITVKGADNSILTGAAKLGKYTIKHELSGKGILLTTARRFKGLEANVVIVIDIDKKNFFDEESKRVLYVATSRAKHYLDLVSSLNDDELGDIIEQMGGKKNKMAKMTFGRILKGTYQKI